MCKRDRPWTIPVEVSPELAGVMFAMIIVGTFAAYLFYLQGITDAGPVRAGLVGCVEPVSATVISAVWLGTPVGVVDVVGCAMIIGMVFLVTEREEGSGGAASYDGAAYDLPPFQGRATELGYYKARRATRDDFERAKALLEGGHRAMASLGIRAVSYTHLDVYKRQAGSCGSSWSRSRGYQNPTERARAFFP